MSDLPRCATCKHWTEDGDEDGRGDCSALGPGTSFGAWAYGHDVEPDDYGFICPPDFGCSLHEPKETK